MEYFVSFKILFIKTPFSDVTSGVFELLKKNKDQNRKQNEIHVCYWNISREPESTVDISESEIGEIGNVEENFCPDESGTLLLGSKQTCYN